jgi:hypothetical protein
MLIGTDFAWGHIGKTAGDATVQLFRKVAPDLVEFAHERTEPSKHQPFPAAPLPVLMKDVLILNTRRLPSWMLSLAQHRARFGTAEDPTPQPLPPASELAESKEADQTLDLFTANGRIRIDRWFRVEHLREDFLDFVAERRTLTDEERSEARTMTTKPANKYDHDIRTVFEDDHVRRLYANNPGWAEVERRVYGYLPYQRLRGVVAARAPFGPPRPALGRGGFRRSVAR